jgi:hypothetical protein
MNKVGSPVSILQMRTEAHISQATWLKVISQLMVIIYTLHQGINLTFPDLFTRSCLVLLVDPRRLPGILNREVAFGPLWTQAL